MEAPSLNNMLNAFLCLLFSFEIYYPFSSNILMILTWNCRGAASPIFRSSCRSLVELYKPLILVILEPHISGEKADKVVKQLGFSFNLREEANGFSGGI